LTVRHKNTKLNYVQDHILAGRQNTVRDILHPGRTEEDRCPMPLVTAPR
jgi:hypothetical protein